MNDNYSDWDDSEISQNFTKRHQLLSSPVMTIAYSSLFMIVIPYIFIVTLFYKTRNTDNRQPQFSLLMHMIFTSFFCVVGCLILAIIRLCIASAKFSESEDLKASPQQLLFFYFLIIIPISTATMYLNFLLLIAAQRLALITRAKGAMQLLTGRRLSFLVIFSYILALVVNINKILHAFDIRWTEIILTILTIVCLMVSCLITRHIGKKVIARNHITVLAQTIPLVIINIIFIIVEVYCSLQKNEQLHFVRVVHGFSMSVATPVFLVCGSWVKRRIVWSIVTCDWDEQQGRGELYTADRTPFDYSNAVSLAPTPAQRF